MRMGPLSFPWMRRAQSHVSGLFILDFVIIVIVFLFFYLLPTFHALLWLSMLHLLFLDFSLLISVLRLWMDFRRFNIHILSDRNRMTLTHSHIVTGFRQVYRLIPNDFRCIAL